MTSRKALTILSCTAALVGGCYLSAASLVQNRTVALTYDLSGKRIPVWSWGYLVVISDDNTATPKLETVDRTGHLRETVFLSIPQATQLMMNDAVRSRDGIVASSGVAYTADGRAAGFFARSSTATSSTLVVRTAPYRPFKMAYASDGTLWTAGSEVVGGEESGADYHVLRHFNAAGELIGSYLPRSTFRSRSEIEYGYMSSVDGRIGWYCGPIAGPGGRYYEVTNDGIQQFPGLPLTKGDYVDGIGVTEGGGVYASTESPSKHKWELFVLDKALGSWRTVLLPGVSGVSRWARLYGSDGTSLVFAPGKPSILTFFDIVD